eukprot:TRINITY_DN6435_c0_g1_i1.p1 TRINITY_DN6435_c0_g1~~TRINITY_DN6435_c0_g1_i1.p1  ORF type:complete len:219 (-),score=30.20 TRINITY_DN6435_c0_g1_i1:242-898(-)
MEYKWVKPTPKKESQLVIHNSLSNKINEFIPLRQNQVSWYICGPTVYDSAHFGHGRNYMMFDVVRRILEDYLGYKVFQVMNITDIDDKIIIKARKKHLITKYLAEHPTIDDQVKKDFLDALPIYAASLTKKIAENQTVIDNPKISDKSEAEGQNKLYQERLDKIPAQQSQVQSWDPSTHNFSSPDHYPPHLSDLLDILSGHLDSQFGIPTKRTFHFLE